MASMLTPNQFEAEQLTGLRYFQYVSFSSAQGL